MKAIPSVDTILPTKHNATRSQLRGSSLLLAGRSISIVIKFAVQVLIVRYLTELDPTKATYGAFALVLTIVNLGETIATFGLNRAITRFVPIYQEQQDYNRLLGTILLIVGTIVALGLSMMLIVYGSHDWLARIWLQDQQVIALLLILIGLAPVQALDMLLVSMFAIFAPPRAIFFRKYILAPSLTLVVVVLVFLERSHVFLLAWGYLAAGVASVAIYIVSLVRLLRRQGLFLHFDIRSITIPASAVFAFTIPLLTSDLVYMLMNSSDTLLLGYFGSTVDVAALRAVQPVARLNQVVFSSFGLLFMPQVARLFARHDQEGINHLYWQTTIWIAIISFPIFALTFSLAQPLTVLLFSERYADSAMILALLSLGHYFNGALGFNATTLMVLGKVRYIVALNIAAALVNIALNVLLIPSYGAQGAAIATCTTLIIYNTGIQAGLQFYTDINLFEWRYLKVYVIIALSALGLLLLQMILSAPVVVSFALTACTSVLVLRLNRKALNIEQTFPEVLRFPLVRRLLGNSRAM